MKESPVVHSLLALPCYRILGQEYDKGTLECTNGQIQFRKKDRLYSIPFHQIENVELRSIDNNPQIIFLTQVGLIIFYFYKETSHARIDYMYESIKRLLNTNERENFPILYTLPVSVRGTRSESDKGELVFFETHFSLRTSSHIYTYPTIPSSFNAEDNFTLPGHCGDLRIKSSQNTILKMLLSAIQDGGILGIWKGSSQLWLGVDSVLIISHRNLLIYQKKWIFPSKYQISPIDEIQKIYHTHQEISFHFSKSKTISLFPSKSSIDIPKRIISTIIRVSSQPQKDVCLVYWMQKNTVLRAYLELTPQHLILYSSQKTLQWSWEKLCRDDDEDAKPNTISLRYGINTLRFYVPNNDAFIENFHHYTQLPYRRLHWKELSPLAKERIFHNATAHIRSRDQNQFLVGRLTLNSNHIVVHPLSLTQLSTLQDVSITLHTESGKYSFVSRAKILDQVLTLTPPTSITLSTQRKYPRYLVQQNATFAKLEFDEQVQRWRSNPNINNCMIQNISENGICIISPIELAVGQRILIDIEKYPQQIICIVRHQQIYGKGMYRLGLMFSSKSKPIRRNIETILLNEKKEQNE